MPQPVPDPLVGKGLERALDVPLELRGFQPGLVSLIPRAEIRVTDDHLRNPAPPLQKLADQLERRCARAARHSARQPGTQGTGVSQRTSQRAERGGNALDAA